MMMTLELLHMEQQLTAYMKGAIQLFSGSVMASDLTVLTLTPCISHLTASAHHVMSSTDAVLTLLYQILSDD